MKSILQAPTSSSSNFALFDSELPKILRSLKQLLRSILTYEAFQAEQDASINPTLIDIFKDSLKQIQNMQNDGQFQKKLNVYEKQVLMVRLITEGSLQRRVYKLVGHSGDEQDHGEDGVR